MSEENRHQHDCDPTNPEEKMLGQLWGIYFLLVHDGRILPGLIELHSLNYIR
jgi:hypothetical protein